MSRIDQMKRLYDELFEVYCKKNADYGDSFGWSIRKYGLIASIVRIGDKFSRFENIVLSKEQKVDDESLRDTLMDMANYLVMTVAEMEEEDGLL